MSLTQITVSGTTFDVYGDQPELVSHAAGTLFPVGVSLTTDVDRQAQLLVTATRILERLAWAGDRFDTATPQPLQWPRINLNDADGNPLDGSTTPQCVFDGFFDLAIALDRDGTLELVAGGTGGNVQRTRSLDRVEGAVTTEREMQFFRPVSVPGTALNLPLNVFGSFRRFLAGFGSGIALSFATGTDLPSEFGRGGRLSNYGFVESGLP